MRRISFCVLASVVSVLVLGVDALAQNYSDVRKLTVFRDSGQGFQIQAVMDNGTAYLMLTNGDRQFVMRRSALLPQPSLQFVSGAVDKLTLNWAPAPPGVNNCCILAMERFIDEEDRECTAVCEDCSCMACYEPCDPVYPEPPRPEPIYIEWDEVIEVIDIEPN